LPPPPLCHALGWNSPRRSAFAWRKSALRCLQTPLPCDSASTQHSCSLVSFRTTAVLQLYIRMHTRPRAHEHAQEKRLAVAAPRTLLNHQLSPLHWDPKPLQILRPSACTPTTNSPSRDCSASSLRPNLILPFYTLGRAHSPLCSGLSPLPPVSSDCYFSSILFPSLYLSFLSSLPILSRSSLLLFSLFSPVLSPPPERWRRRRRREREVFLTFIEVTEGRTDPQICLRATAALRRTHARTHSLTHNSASQVLQRALDAGKSPSHASVRGQGTRALSLSFFFALFWALAVGSTRPTKP